MYLLLPNRFFIICLLLALISAFCSPAQEENSTVQIGQHYIDLKIKDFQNFNKKLERRQKHLLKKLSKKEKRFAKKLLNKDSLSYVIYSRQPGNFDSIAKFSNADSNAFKNKWYSSTPNIDTVKRIQKFLATGDVTDQSRLSNLEVLQRKLSYRQYIGQLIDKRIKELSRISPQNSGINCQAIKKISYYGQEKINAIKALEDEPSRAEQRALEYLEGQKDFNQAISSSNLNEKSNGSESFKSQLYDDLQKKFNDQFDGLASGLGKNVSDYSKSLQNATVKLKSAKQFQNSINQARQSSESVLGFKVNPMRCKPFLQRLEKQFTWQVNRASANGMTPSILQLAGMVGFRQSPKLTTGVGVGIGIGLGQNFSNIHFSFQGLSVRTYVNYKIALGISAYVGYERTLKLPSVIANNENLKASELIHNNHNYQESALLGLTERYMISQKLNGAIQLLYDFWWKDNDRKTPFILRIAFQK